MPLGNGDIALNAWVEEGGDLLFYISKTDAWDENARLLKLGRIRVSADPGPYPGAERFEQRLDPATGTLTVTVAKGRNPCGCVCGWMPTSR